MLVQLDVVNHSHMETFVLILLVTYVRPSELPCAGAPKQECLPRQRSSMGLSSCTEHVTVEPASIGCAVSELCRNSKDQPTKEHSAVSQNITKEMVWRPPTTLSRAHSETSWKYCGQRLQILWFAKRMTWKYVLDVFGGSGVSAGLHGHVLDNILAQV